MNLTFNYGSDYLTSGIALAIASGKIKGVLSAETVIRVYQSQQNVQDIIASKKTVYGINTGFGILANTSISEDDTRLLQYKILQSHSVGGGDAVRHENWKRMLINT